MKFFQNDAVLSKKSLCVILGGMGFVLALSLTFLILSAFTCSIGFVFHCNETNTYVKKHQMCNRYDDCPSGLDEANCPCMDQEYGCKDGRCVSVRFMCDGVQDCLLGEDEEEPICSKCSNNTRRCSSENYCFTPEMLCDNVQNCLKGDDENDCLFIKDDRLRATKDGKMNYVCADGWDDKFNQEICILTKNINSSGAHSVDNTIGSNETFVSLSFTQASNDLKSILNCTGALILPCIKKTCGKQQTNQSSTQRYIVDGYRSKKGMWPWFVAIYYKKHFLCGGTLVSDQWVLTADHCLRHPKNQEKFEEKDLHVVLGTEVLGGSEGLQIEIIEIKTLDLKREAFLDDIGIIKLAKPVTFTMFIQPACLPEKEMNNLKVCYFIGHGATFTTGFSKDILQTRTSITNHFFCKSIMNKGNPENELCLYSGTLGGICPGDSGGPLMCTNDDLFWTVVGVSSHTYGRKKKGSSFNAREECVVSLAMKVSHYWSWIRSIIKG